MLHLLDQASSFHKIFLVTLLFGMLICPTAHCHCLCSCTIQVPPKHHNAKLVHYQYIFCAHFWGLCRLNGSNTPTRFKPIHALWVHVHVRPPSLQDFGIRTCTIISMESRFTIVFYTPANCRSDWMPIGFRRRATSGGMEKTCQFEMDEELC